MSEAEVKMEDDRAADAVDDIDMDDGKSPVTPNALQSYEAALLTPFYLLFALPTLSDPNVKRRGRGFDPRGNGPASEGVKAGRFDTLDDAGDISGRAAKCMYLPPFHHSLVSR